jgi:PAS domain S-box-containing protein
MTPFRPEEHADGILAAVLESSDDPIVTTDLGGIVCSWNRAAERLFGYGADEIVGQAISVIVPAELRNELSAILGRIRTGEPVEQPEAIRQAKDGHLVNVSVSVGPVRDAAGDVVGAVAIFADLTARKRSDAALRTSEVRWRSVIDSAVDGIIVIDAQGRVEAFNRGAERLFGYRAAEVLGHNVNMLMPSPYREEHDAYLARYLTTGTAKIIGIGREVSGRRRDGSVFPLHLSVGEMAIGGEVKFTGVLHDLTERVELEHRLRTSESRWRSIIESAVDGIVVIDARGRIEAFNPSAERLFGYTEGDVVGHMVNVLMPSPYREEHDGYLARYLATGEQKIIGIGRDVTGLRRDGTTFPLHLSVGEITIEGERKFTGILHDLSGRVRIEEQLREQTALARLGEMAAVIAHEVKNPLAGVRGAIQVIGSRLPQDGKDAAMVHEIIARIDALNELMKDLLLFARPPHPKPASVELASLVATTATLLRNDPTLRDVEVQIGGATPHIVGDPDLLKIVFENLLVNGAQAMRGHGTMHVSIETNDSNCRIAIHDSGPGIPPDVREKIFAPFFTTKARGSGLGLPTAKRLVEAHRGTIHVTCPEDGGTTVTIDLPVESNTLR